LLAFGAHGMILCVIIFFPKHSKAFPLAVSTTPISNNPTVSSLMIQQPTNLQILVYLLHVMFALKANLSWEQFIVWAVFSTAYNNTQFYDGLQLCWFPLLLNLPCFLSPDLLSLCLTPPLLMGQDVMLCTHCLVMSTDSQQLRAMKVEQQNLFQTL
jgi:hypothetical protein